MARSENRPITQADQPLGRAFASVCAQAPARLAIAGDGQSVTFAGLDEHSRALAGALAARGIGPGDRVMIALGRGVDFVTAVLGVTRSGAAYVPVDPTWPASRLAELIEIVRPAAGIGDALEGLKLPFKGVAELVEQGQPEAARFTDRNVGRGDPLYVMFTSGTTGIPKAVVVPHRAVRRLVYSPDFMDAGPDRVWLQLAATSFDAATLEIWTPLIQGGTIVPVTDALPTLDRIADLIARHGVTDAWLTASLFNAIVDHRIGAFAGMKQVLTGGERLSPIHVGMFLERWPDVRLINGYGPTENTTFTCCHTITPADVKKPNGIPIGVPIGGTEVRVVDEELNDVPVGEAGELLAGGDGLALGYLGDEELTAERFVTTESGGPTQYRTGDLVKQSAQDGPLEFLGRRDRQVKVRGHRIELEEVECTLRAHEAVGEVFVFTLGDRADIRRLVAGITPSDSRRTPDPVAIREWALDTAQEYLVPDAIIVLESVPVGPNGKADADAIRAIVAGSIGHTGSVNTDSGIPANWDELESLLGEVLPGTHIGPDDGFVSVGGHSIAALRLAALIQKHRGILIGIGEIIRCGALRDLAERIESAGQRSAPIFEAAKEDNLGQGSLPASSIQRQFFFENVVDPTGVAYHEHAAFRVEFGELDLARLEDAFRALVVRHEALRTRLVMTDDGLVQEIDPPEAASRAMFTAHGCVDWNKGAEIPDTVWVAVSQRFDLERHVPVRMDVFGIEAGGHAVVMTFQHAAIDEWSLGILERELGVLYSDAEGAEVVSQRYQDFCAAERVHTDDEAVIAIADRLLELPQPAVPLGHAPDEGVVVGSDDGWITESDLAELARRYGATPTAVLAGVYATALGEVFELGRVAILTPVSHREIEGLQGVVGCCNTMHALIVGAGRGREESDLQGVVDEVSDSLLSAYDSAWAPFALVAKEVHRRGPSRGLVVPFGFAYETSEPFGPAMGGLGIEPITIRSGIARFPIGLSVDHRDRRMRSTLSAPVGANAETMLYRIQDAMRRIVCDATGQAVLGASSRVPFSETGSRIAANETPETEEYRVLRAAARAAWKDLLGSPPANDSARFFDHGGHSLLLLRLAARIRKETGLEIPLASFLQDPTFGHLVASLGSLVRKKAAGAGFQIEEFGKGRNVVIGVPGAFGRPISFQHVADAFAAMGSDVRLRCYNVFDAMGDGDVTNGFDQVLDRLALDLAKPDTVGMLGFCAGGLYPFFLDALPAAYVARSRLWLLNVYAPDYASHAVSQRLESMKEAVVDVRSLPRACFDSAVTLGRMAAVRIRGRDRGVSADHFSQAEFRQLLVRRTLRAWHGKSTVIIAGRKPVWRTYYRNDHLNGLDTYLTGPHRMVVLPVLHHQLLGIGAERIALEIAEDIENDLRSSAGPAKQNGTA